MHNTTNGLCQDNFIRRSEALAALITSFIEIQLLLKLL